MEQITIKIPQGWDEITIGQYQEYMDVLKTTDERLPMKRMISLLSVLTDTDEAVYYKMSMDVIHEITESVGFMNEEPKGNFNRIITINGVEYGFQYNMNELTLGEWIDLEHYITNGVIENLHYIAAILYRPIINKGDEYFEYEIADYTTVKLEGTAKLFKYNVSVDDIYGISVFFYTIANELLMPMSSFLSKTNPTEEETRQTLTTLMGMVKDAGQKKKLMQLLKNNDLKSGIGSYLSTIFVKETSGDMKQS